jgi:hypothetical protein
MILLRALLQLWDADVWWTKARRIQGVLPITIQQIKILLNIATTLFNFAQDISFDALPYDGDAGRLED